MPGTARRGCWTSTSPYPASGSGRKGSAEMESVDVDFAPESTQAFKIGAASCAVPGAPAGLEAAHRAYGSLPWARLIEPAIGLATQRHRGDPRAGVPARDPRCHPAAYRGGAGNLREGRERPRRRRQVGDGGSRPDTRDALRARCAGLVPREIARAIVEPPPGAAEERSPRRIWPSTATIRRRPSRSATSATSSTRTRLPHPVAC